MLGVHRTVLVFLALTVSAAMAGCASAPPTPAELEAADYGAPISQQDAEAAAREFLKRHLKDPESSQIEWRGVQRGWLREAPILGGKLRFGYTLVANINAKNSFGGYTGYKPYRFLFFNAVLVSAYAQQDLGSGTTYMGKIF